MIDLEEIALDKEFAEKYTEYVGYDYKRYGTCGINACGSRIDHRFKVRDQDTGEIEEIGGTCCKHWCDYQHANHGKIPGLVGRYPLEIIAPGPRLRRARGIYKRRHGNLEGFEDSWWEKRRREELKNNYRIVRHDVPLRFFSSVEEAHETAKDYNGWCDSDITMPNGKFWCFFLPSIQVDRFQREVEHRDVL